MKEEKPQRWGNRAGGAVQGAGRFRHQRRQHDQAGKLPGGANFIAAQFYADVQGHPEDRNVALALEELEFFSHEVKILGVYPAHPYRVHGDAAEK